MDDKKPYGWLGLTFYVGEWFELSDGSEVHIRKLRGDRVWLAVHSPHRLTRKRACERSPHAVYTGHRPEIRRSRDPVGTEGREGWPPEADRSEGLRVREEPKPDKEPT